MEKIEVIEEWGFALDDLIQALRDFRESIGWMKDDALFMRLYGKICAAGGDLDDFKAGGVGIDGFRELLTGG